MMSAPPEPVSSPQTRESSRGISARRARSSQVCCRLDNNGTVTLDRFFAHFCGTASSGLGNPASVARLERIIDVTEFMSVLETRAQETA